MKNILKKLSQKKNLPQIKKTKSTFLILFVFLGSYLVNSQIWAKDCHSYKSAYEILDSASIFEIPDDQEFKKRVLLSYLDYLDPYKMYLSDNDASLLVESKLSLDFSSVSEVCESIESIGKFFNLRISKIHRWVVPLWKEITSEGYREEAGALRMVVDPAYSSYTQSSAELKDRWKKRLIFEKLKLSQHPMDVISNVVLHYIKAQHELMKKSQYPYIAFIKAFFSEVDPHSTYHPPYALLPTHQSLQEQEHKWGYRLKDISLNEYTRYLTKTLLPQPSEVVWSSQKKKAFGFPSSAYMNSGDRLIPFLDETNVPNTIQYLKQTYQGYEWHKLEKNQNAFRYFSEPLQSMYGYFKLEEQKHQAAQDLHRHKSVSVGYLYLNNSQFKNRSVQEGIELFSHSLHERLYKMEEKLSIPVSLLILDLRSSRLGQLPIFLEVLSTILPKKPVLRLQDREGAHTIYSTKVPTYTLKSDLVVLVNQHTIKLAELMAATLKEYGKALIIGEGLGRRSQGVSVRHILMNHLGIHKPRVWQFAVTQQYYYTPLGKSLDGKGVKPHITLPLEVDLPSGQKQSLESFYSHRLGKRDISPLKELCISPLPKHLIEELKARSYDRILKRSYPRLEKNIRTVKNLVTKDSKGGTEKVWRSFSETFRLTEQQLRSEKPRICDHKDCGTVSLKLKDYKKNDALFAYTSEHIRSSSPVPQDMFDIFEQLALEDPVLLETLHIAIDYHRYLEGLPYIPVELLKTLESAHTHPQQKPTHLSSDQNRPEKSQRPPHVRRISPKN